MNKLSFFALSLASICTASAADYYVGGPDAVYDYSKVKWVDSAGVAYANPPSATDKIIFGDSHSTLILDQNVEVAAIDFLNTGTPSGKNIEFNGTSKDLTLKINGDVFIQKYARFSVNNLYIKGNISNVDVGAWVWLGHHNTKLNSLNIDGNLYCTTDNTIINVVRDRSEVGSGSFANADTEIKGLFYGNKTVKFLSGNTSGTQYDTFIKVGGFNQSVAIQTNIFGLVGADKTINLMFTNDGISNKDTEGNAIVNCSNTSQISETIGGAKLKLYMNGGVNVSQSFTSVTMKFTGGVNVSCGRLNLNFRETSGVNHGNLEISGAEGVFGNSYYQSGGSFLFSNVLVSASGKIALKFTNSTTFDSLTLIDNGENAFGSVRYADGYNGKLNILMEGSNTALQELIDSTLNGGKGIKIVSWEAQSEIDENNFVSNSITKDGKTYVGQFSNEADGLYLKYVAVPEPAELAAAFGLLALGLAFMRRRSGK